MKVVIVGGSISGLVHGLMLKHHGHSVHILERASRDLEAQGAGVGTAAEVKEFMARHDRVGTPYALPSYGVHVLDRDSKQVQEVRIPMQMSTWDAMYYRLRANFDGLASKYCPNPPADESSDGEVSYDMGKEVVGVDASGLEAPVVVRYVDKATGEEMPPLTADLVIGADGPSSAVKRMIAPHAPARKYSGYIAWRGIIPESAVTPSIRETLSDWFTFHIAAAEYVVVYPIPGPHGTLDSGSRGLNFVWYQWTSEYELKDILTDTDGHTHRWSVPSGKLRPDVWASQKAYGLSKFSKEFCAMLEVTDRPFVQVVSDCESPTDPGPGFFGGRVLLVGDAQTILRPHTGFALNQTARHCLDLEKRLPELEAAIRGAGSEAAKSDGLARLQAVEKWNTEVLEFSHIARLRAITIGMLYLGSKLAAMPHLLRWKAAELWLAAKKAWRRLIGTSL